MIILALLPTVPKMTPNLKPSIPHALVGRGGDAKRLQLIIYLIIYCFCLGVILKMIEIADVSYYLLYEQIY